MTGGAAALVRSQSGDSDLSSYFVSPGAGGRGGGGAEGGGGGGAERGEAVD